MAIVRFGNMKHHGYVSDIYILQLPNGHYQCCGCALTTGGKSYTVAEVSVMCFHVQSHKTVGHRVPDWTIDRLLDRAKGIIHPDPVIAELVMMARKKPGGKVMSDDIDVPADLRITTPEILAEMEKTKRSAE